MYKRQDQDHATYPDRIIYGSETGSGLDAWYAVRDKDFIFGQLDVYKRQVQYSGTA